MSVRDILRSGHVDFYEYYRIKLFYLDIKKCLEDVKSALKREKKIHRAHVYIYEKQSYVLYMTFTMNLFVI